MKQFEYEPAMDSDLPAKERSTSVRREAGLIPATINLGWRLTCITYMRAVHRLAVVGRDQIPATRPFVLIANHCSHLDTLALSASLPRHARRNLYPLAAADTFFDSPTSRLIASNLINALPVKRGKAMTHAITDLRQRMAKPSDVYILFPEGTRSQDGNMGRFKSGLGMLVAETPVPVVPCHIQGAFKAWPRHRKLPHPHRIRVTIGTPITFAQIPNNRSGWEQVAQMAQQAIESMSEQHHPSQ